MSESFRFYEFKLMKVGEGYRLELVKFFETIIAHPISDLKSPIDRELFV